MSRVCLHFLPRKEGCNYDFLIVILATFRAINISLAQAKKKQANVDHQFLRCILDKDGLLKDYIRGSP